MTKKYYWLKLQENFFDEDTIQWLEEQKNGKEYCLFYLKLCLKSLKTNGSLIRNVGTILIPYDVNKLSEITRTDFDTVVVAMELFKKIGLIEILENGEIYLAQLNNMVGSETKWAGYKKNERDKKGKLDNVQLESKKCPHRDRDRDRDKEIELDNSISKDILVPNDLVPIVEKWGSLNLSKLVSIKGTRLKLLNARIKDYGVDKVIEAIENINKSSFLKGQSVKNWVITFDWFIKPSNFPKVLEGNYNDKQIKGSEKSGYTKGNTYRHGGMSDQDKEEFNYTSDNGEGRQYTDRELEESGLR